MVRLTVDFWALDIRLELSWLRSYLELLERYLASLPANPPDTIRAELNDPDDDVRQPTQQEWGILSEEVAPRLARGSYIVALYAAYESATRELAEDLQKRLQVNLTIEDIRGHTYVNQARKFFDRVLGIPLCPDETQWSIINELVIVRNVFAHSHGRFLGLNARGRAIFDAMANRGDAKELSGGIFIEGHYLTRALNVVDASLRDLIERSKTPRLSAGNRQDDLSD